MDMDMDLYSARTVIRHFGLYNRFYI